MDWIIPFALGGYFVPALIHFIGVYRVEVNAPDNPTTLEVLYTAAMHAATWPLQPTQYEPDDNE